ncbi:hypothetical protein F5X97DRAFT_317303 [Nemania serpens]|nr:hypothetical protein F5X97DRAFT_317303 [Nemania serpens]
MEIEPKEPVTLATKLLVNWNQYVKDTVPPKKLLVMQLQEGWEPLCKFIGVPVPDGPLPRANDTEAILQLSSHVTRRIIQIWTTGLITIAAVGFGTWQAWKTLQ